MNCLCWLSTNTKLWENQIWRLRGCWGSAAGADVPPNCRSHHAETILLNHFKASAISVTGRLDQLQNALFPFLTAELTAQCCILGSEKRRKKGEKVLRGDLQLWSWLTLVCQCLHLCTVCLWHETEGKNVHKIKNTGLHYKCWSHFSCVC